MPYICEQTLTATYLKRVETTPDAVGFQTKKGGKWQKTTFREFHRECREVSFGLISAGIRSGDRVGLFSSTRYEWALSDMAVLGALGVTVPIYPSHTPDETAYILSDSQAKLVFVEDASQLAKILEVRDRLPILEKIVTFDPLALKLAKDRSDVLSLSALRELGKREEARFPTQFESNLRSAAPNDMITICYTSGTTGTPKGVMLTHDNLISAIEDGIKSLSQYTRPEAEVLLTFLPFSHILGKIEEMATYAFGWCESYVENPNVGDNLIKAFAEVQPTLLIGVPRLFEKANQKIDQIVKAAPKSKQKIFEWAMEAGMRYHSAIRERKPTSLRRIAEHTIASHSVFRLLQKRFGGRLKLAVCGGAPLATGLGERFEALGIPLLEGYGLTETSGPIAVNTPKLLKFGTVGRPLPEVAVRLDEDGEILIRSRKVFKGYFNLPKETEEAFTDGWFRTGDIGQIDSEGFLKITDRKKDLIITSGGKNVAPQKIENLARSKKYISQFVVLGDRKNYLTALVTLDPEQLTRYAKEHLILFSDLTTLVKHPKIEGLVQGIVDEINQSLPSYETIKKFIILPKDFSVESGELTPSLKIRRQVIARHYQAELDILYGS